MIPPLLIAVAGYYHPTMKTVDGRVIPSSDRLLHEFLQPTLVDGSVLQMN